MGRRVSKSCVVLVSTFTMGSLKVPQIFFLNSPPILLFPFLVERGQPVCGLPGLQREYKVKAIMVSTFFRTCLMFIPPPPPPNNYWGTRLEKGKLGPRTLISYSLRPVVFLPPSQGHSGQALSLSLCGKDNPYLILILFCSWLMIKLYDTINKAQPQICYRNPLLNNLLSSIFLLT